MINRRDLLKLMAAAGGSLSLGPLLCGCSSGSSPKSVTKEKKPRLVLLYAPCTVNTSYLSPYNIDVKYTPNLARFSEESVVFVRHQTECGQSGVAFASIFSGGQAPHHGNFHHPRKLDDSVYLITEAFSDNGYDVFYWGKHPMADHKLNYDQGTPGKQTFDYLLKGEDDVFERILERISLNKSYKAFILTNFTVTHGPYNKRLHLLKRNKELREAVWNTDLTDSEFIKYVDIYNKYVKELNMFFLTFEFDATMRKSRLSSGELLKLYKTIEIMYKIGVFYLDKLFGNVIRSVENYDLLDESLIAFTADHGEVMYRKNAIFKFVHGFQLAPEVLNVPLIIRGPSVGIQPGRYEPVTRSIDVFPTLTGLSGLDIPRNIGPVGTNLADVLRGRTSATELPAYSHTSLAKLGSNKKESEHFRKFYPKSLDPNLMWVSVRIKDMTYKIAKFNVDNPDFTPAVFDLAKDPTEERNLFDPANVNHRAIMKKLSEYRRNLFNSCKIWYEKYDSGVSNSEALKKLRNLGYIN